jgi:radical SAM protein with 4Fe4S-binding SPASM domain
VLIDVGVGQWQVQLTVAMGNAVDNPDLLLQPYQLLELFPLLAELTLRARREGVLVVAGNNIGYFGPYEHLWRQGVDTERNHWSGCSAGETTMGIESDGTIKGCPSLPTARYTAGKVGDLDPVDIWTHGVPATASSLRSPQQLWGFCASCYYAEVCTGGCTWTADALFARPGNNPYCHYRALRLAAQGIRERVVKVKDAPDAAFATGRFELIQESLNRSPSLSAATAPSDPQRITRARRDTQVAARASAPLRLCRACNQFVKSEELTCPMCDQDLAAADAAYETERLRRKQIMSDVRTLIAHATATDIVSARASPDLVRPPAKGLTGSLAKEEE